MIELWAGAECTVNRVGDRWFDQLRSTGHLDRLDDIDRIAALGARRVRVGVLWERVAPDGLARADWRWSDAVLARLLELGITPIVGLVHHGSGPVGTDLCDPSFVAGVARFAAAVAERYPWVEAWTPINEPLTTARFSALYGHWHPHLRDTASFLRALLNQVHATKAAMTAIRTVVPRAQLVQTEDIGHTSGVPALEYQCRYENERRWSSLDLLVGRVDRDHAMRDHFEHMGIAGDELDRLVDEPCPPDIIGINYYLTSERYLDDRVDLYPPQLRGGNGRQAYADVETVRVRSENLLGHRRIIDEVWNRYARPIAITEVHLGCTRDEQMRWLAEAWNAAESARRDGVDVRAVTVWSVFGAVDWDSLLTRDRGSYEPGVFDIRAPQPRPTALAALARTLADGQQPHHPVLASPGWWHRPERGLYDGHAEASLVAPSTDHGAPSVLVVGAAPLAARIVAGCAARGLPCEHRSRLADLEPWSRPPWAVVVVPDATLSLSQLSAPTSAMLRLARRCREQGVACMFVSRDLVFDGRDARPRVESDTPAPATREGNQWHRVERVISAIAPDTLIVRTGPVLDPGDPQGPFARALVRLASGEHVVVTADDLVSPAFAVDIVDPLLDMLIDQASGVWHVGHDNSLSSFELVRTMAQRLGLPTRRLCGSRGHGHRRALASERAWSSSSFDDALALHLSIWTSHLRAKAA